MALLEILPWEDMKSDVETIHFEDPGDAFFSRELQQLSRLRNLCRKVKAKKNAEWLPSKHCYKEKLL